MGNFSKWNSKEENSTEYVVVLLISRNKDNKDIENFHERRNAFVCARDSKYSILRFHRFIREGVPGEFCRMYISVNNRDMIKTNRKLTHYLIDNPDYDLSYIESLIASFAAEKECALDKKWLIDYDGDPEKIDELIQDISAIDSNLKILKYPTPHGYAIITDRGFDTRSLLANWGDVMTVKRDDLLCASWANTPKVEENNNEDSTK